ncbi:UDP-3-O-(3-hydroxymyristoyl)glucosamine N-acyltransferase [Salinispirillum marinum]|uniref:UDP-3-O-acylglucosamine N-acyltransferase n=2 Tax=Saccharospirillaceae TaxID=255527 RepID=A0ABV8BI10_9GAMM
MNTPDRRTYRAVELAELLGGEVKGNPDQCISSIAPIDQASTGQLSFVARRQFVKKAATSKADILLVTADLASSLPHTCIIVRDPYRAYAQVSQLYWEKHWFAPSVHPTAVLADDVVVPADCRIGAQVVIESGVELGTGVELDAQVYVGAGVKIGSGTIIRPRVTLYSGVVIGENCMIQAGTVIGADGFGYARHAGGWEKIAQLGGVRIGNRVEIGANATIDRGALADTVIGDDVIIDNLVQVGHNVVVGERTALVAQCGIAGSTVLGKDGSVGGQSAVGGHLTIADNVHFVGKAMVAQSIENPGQYASGLPVQPFNDWRRAVARIGQLKNLNDKVNTLWAKYGELEAADATPDESSST